MWSISGCIQLTWTQFTRVDRVLLMLRMKCIHNRKKSVRPRCTTEQEDKYIRVSSLWNRHLTSPQMSASLKSTPKTPASTSTVNCQLRTCEASVSQPRHSNVLVLLLSCTPGPPTPLSIIFWLEPVSAVLQFLGNVLSGIAFISQNKNRLTSFRRKLFVSGHVEPVIKHTNAGAPNTQLV